MNDLTWRTGKCPFSHRDHILRAVHTDIQLAALFQSLTPKQCRATAEVKNTQSRDCTNQIKKHRLLQRIGGIVWLLSMRCIAGKNQVLVVKCRAVPVHSCPPVLDNKWPLTVALMIGTSPGSGMLVADPPTPGSDAREAVCLEPHPTCVLL